jgi:hypothetical protein
MSSTDFFIIVFPNKTDSDFNIVCKTKDEIKTMMSDKANIFYECTGDFIKKKDTDGNYILSRDKQLGVIDETPYVKIYGVGGAQIYIDIRELNTLVKSSERVYYLYPAKHITHTISWNNIYGHARDFISASHCQDRTDISVYTLKLCTGDCIISNKYTT